MLNKTQTKQATIDWLGNKELRFSLYLFMKETFGIYNVKRFNADGRPCGLTLAEFHEYLSEWLNAVGLTGYNATAVHQQIKWCCTGQLKPRNWEKSTRKTVLLNRDAAIKAGWMSFEQAADLFRINETSPVRYACDGNNAE